MTYIKLCITGFLISLMFWGCEDDSLSNHLMYLSKENSQISIKGWNVRQHYISFDEEYYSISKVEADTQYFFAFSYFAFDTLYYELDFVKTYNKDKLYHELSLLNEDTLYYFTSISDKNLFKERKSIEDMDFKVGCYCYLSTHGKFDWEQKEFFKQNKDSLIRIRGNCEKLDW